MTKVIIVTPRLQHYRMTFYEKLSKFKEDFDVAVFYGISKVEDGLAGLQGKTRFKSKGFIEQNIRFLPFEITFSNGMFKAVKKESPDVLIIMANTGNLSYRRIVTWARRKNKKIILWTNGYEPPRVKGLFLSFKNQLVTSFYNKADYFLTYSTKASEYVEARGIDESKISICYNGIETDTLEKDAAAIKMKSQEIIKKYDLKNFITFIYVGGLIPRKRIDLLLEAFVSLHKNYNNIKLMIIGDGPLREKLEADLADYNNANILYLGRIIDNVNSYFVASDCLVLPGAGGLALNQAMFWGKPCVVSTADGTEDDLVIDGVTGYRFRANDLNSLKSAMERRINESNEKLDNMSAESHKIIANKSNVNAMVPVFAAAIEKVTHQKSE